MAKTQMIKIAVVDDDDYFLAKLLEIVKEYFKAQNMEVVSETYKRPEQLLWDLEDHAYYDLYLIDIELPGVNGMELAQQIRLKYLEPFLIFISSHAEYSMEGYEYNAFRYIMKEDMEERLPLALEKIVEKMEKIVHRQYIIESYSKIKKFDYEDIYYLYVDGKYTYFRTRFEECRERITLNKAYKKLNAEEFIYIDKSYIVNIHHVMELGDHEVIMRDKKALAISIPKMRSVKRAISNYWSENAWK